MYMKNSVLQSQNKSLDAQNELYITLGSICNIESGCSTKECFTWNIVKWVHESKNSNFGMCGTFFNEILMFFTHL